MITKLSVSIDEDVARQVEAIVNRINESRVTKGARPISRSRVVERLLRFGLSRCYREGDETETKKTSSGVLQGN